MGVYPIEAGAELLIRQGKAIREGAPWLRDIGPKIGQRMVAIGPETLWVESRGWSASERRIVNLAVSLIDGEVMVNLKDAVYGLDSTSLELVLAAIAHAAGSHEATAPGRPEQGSNRGGPANLFPWPSGWTLGGRATEGSHAIHGPHEPCVWCDDPPILPSAPKQRASRTEAHESDGAPNAPQKLL